MIDHRSVNRLGIVRGWGVRWLGFAILACTFADSANAQLFGERTLGRPFEGRGGAAPAAGEAAGTLEGNERFLRENRPRNAFVGSDRRSQQGFVGSAQAIGSGRVVASTESLESPPDPSDRINRPLPPQPSDQLYYPRLVIDFQSQSGNASNKPRVGAREERVLQQRLSRIAGREVVVQTVEGQTILDGQVASESMVQKLAIIASFEPHVDQIVNRLVVVPGAPAGGPGP